MAEVLENIITATTLRAAIRSRIKDGVSRRSVSLLIDTFADDSIGEQRVAEGVVRRPVEHIPHPRREAFLEALADLAAEIPDSPAEAVRLAG